MSREHIFSDTKQGGSRAGGYPLLFFLKHISIKEILLKTILSLFSNLQSLFKIAGISVQQFVKNHAKLPEETHTDKEYTLHIFTSMAKMLKCKSISTKRYLNYIQSGQAYFLLE